MHDIPYVRPKDLTPEITTMMTRICTEIRKILSENIPCGIQVQINEFITENDTEKKSLK